MNHIMAQRQTGRVETGARRTYVITQQSTYVGVGLYCRPLHLSRYSYTTLSGPRLKVKSKG